MEESARRVRRVVARVETLLTEILHNVLVAQLLQELDLALERGEHALLALLVRRRALGELDLLDGHEQAAGRAHAEVDLAERARADERALDPLVGWAGL